MQFAGFADEVFIVRHPRLKIITIKIINLYSEEPLFENNKNDNNYGHLSLIRKLIIIIFVIFIMIIIIAIIITMIISMRKE